MGRLRACARVRLRRAGAVIAENGTKAPHPPSLYLQHIFYYLTAPIPPWTTGGREHFRPFSRPSTHGLWVDRSTHAISVWATSPNPGRLPQKMLEMSVTSKF